MVIGLNLFGTVFRTFITCLKVLVFIFSQLSKKKYSYLVSYISRSVTFHNGTKSIYSIYKKIITNLQLL